MFEILPNWHPLAVHFTVALLLTSSLLFLVGTIFPRRAPWSAATLVARWNLGLGIMAALLTLATGWQAYNTVAHDTPSHANMTVHLRWAVAASALFVVAGILAWIDRRRAAGAGPALLAAIVLGSVALAVTGWFGGENVYRYGLGVMSLPKSDGHKHGGEHMHGMEEPGHDHGASAEPGTEAAHAVHNHDDGDDTVAPTAPMSPAPATEQLPANARQNDH
jgi:uncharacterized membrane protein